MEDPQMHHSERRVDCRPESSKRGDQILRSLTSDEHKRFVLLESTVLGGAKTCAKRHSVPGLGNCAYESIIGALLHERDFNGDIVEGDQISVLKSAMFKCASLMITGVSLDDAGRESAPPEYLDLLISKEQRKAASFFDMTELISGEPATSFEEGTIGWFRTHIKWVHAKVGFWLRMKWLALAAAVLDRTIMVWEPTGDHGELRLYSTCNGNSDGLFFLNKKNKQIHLLYSTLGDPTRARDTTPGVSSWQSQHNHFDFLELNPAALKVVDEMINTGLSRMAPMPHLESTGLLENFPTVGGPKTSPAEQPKVSPGKAPKASCGKKRKMPYGKVAGVSSGNDPGVYPGDGLDTERHQRMCTALIERGPNKNTRCGAKSKPPGSGRCGRHKGLPRQLKKRRGEDTGGKGGGGDNEGKPYYGSDGELVGGEDYLATKGACMSTPNGQDKVLQAAQKIAKPEYREVYLHVAKMKPKAGDEENNNNEDDDLDGECEDDGEDGIGWTGRGMMPEENSQSYEARRQKEEGIFTLSEEMFAKLPKLDREGYEPITGDVGALAFRFFNITFPPEAVDLMKTHMAMCNTGNDNSGGRVTGQKRKRGSQDVGDPSFISKWNPAGLRMARRCSGAECKKRTRGTCECKMCRQDPLVMCKECASNSVLHNNARARRYAVMKNGTVRSRKPVKR